jgi:hypothetical protein
LDTFRIFFAHSFATEKWNHLAEHDVKHGVSDSELADLVARWIDKFSAGQIEVVRTRDPYHNYISSSVREDICSAHAVLCLFTKRTKDSVTGLWIPSTYVLSEGSAALMQFASEAETHRRLFGLVEEGIDPVQLGMAFHGNKTAQRFRRDDLTQFESRVRGIVDEILRERAQVRPHQEYEYLSIDKVAYIRRSRAVWIRTRHRYRFTAKMSTVRIPHTMWRVSKELPTLRELLKGTQDSASGFLGVMPLHCGLQDPERCLCHIKEGEPDFWGYERNFFVEFPEIHVNPGDELAYEIAWGYPDAFHKAENGRDEKPHSVGLRTGIRGPVGSASLTLKFQRDWQFEPFRTLENPPKLLFIKSAVLPGSHHPEEFLHKNKSWQPLAELRTCPKRSGMFSEVYYWCSSSFDGMVKAIWEPHQNYFLNVADPAGVEVIDENRPEYPYRRAGK